MPKLSIITINLNNEIGLRKTIKSVTEQSFSDFEYIIIDGGSTDSSVEVIKEFADRINYWISEPDKGIYNAMNKGILMSKGVYLYFLNSGDCLVDNSVLDLVFKISLDVDIITGNTLMMNKTKVLRKWEAPVTFDLETAIYFGLSHPASFIKKSLFQKFGQYNERRKIAADWEFFIKVIIQNNATYERIPLTISIFDESGISLTNVHEMERERNEILSEIYPPEVVSILFKYCSLKALEDKYINNGLVQASIYFSNYSLIRKVFNRGYSFIKSIKTNN